MSKLSHVDEQNRPTMVDVSAKQATDRSAHARAVVHLPVSIAGHITGDEIETKKGLVFATAIIAGTGLGHVNRKSYPALERAREAGVQVYMTLQTLWGFVQMHVYETGREILQLGVVPLANMLPEAAYIKLGWALGMHPDDPAAARKLMTTPIADEMTPREALDALGSLSVEGVDRLVSIYGGRAAAVAELCSQNPGLLRALDGGGRVLAAEVVFALRDEFARTLEDIVFRRMMIGFDADQGRLMYDEIAALAADEAGWSPEQTTQQLEILNGYAQSLRVG